MQPVINSFKAAIHGILFLIKTERNFKIHLACSILVLIFSYVFQVTKIEFCVLLLASASVFTAEAFNTSIEILLDKIHPEQHPKIGVCKDVSAGAVLISAIFSASIAAIIFIPKMYLFLK